MERRECAGSTRPGCVAVERALAAREERLRGSVTAQPDRTLPRAARGITDHAQHAGDLARLGGPGDQNCLNLGWIVHQRQIVFAHGGNFAVDPFKDQLFRITPGNAIGVGRAQGRGFFRRGKGLVDLEQR